MELLQTLEKPYNFVENRENQRCEIISVRDGVVAVMDYLHCVGEYANAVRPNLVLLDLNLPKKDRREVLAEIKTDPQLQSIPVVVLTTSLNEEDISKSYELHVNCYMAKSRNLPELFKTVQVIKQFWLDTVILPS
jgi:two-component system, chemotaxis family, response regulator Rcp1